jgi:hypothetical protein
MRVEFHPPTDPDTVVATALWTGSTTEIRSEDDEIRSKLERAFRPTPIVVVDDPSYRKQGTQGEVVIQPGTMEWFRAAAQVRVPAETGLASRLVPGITEGGFDPAAQYRDFNDTMSRLTTPMG